MSTDGPDDPSAPRTTTQPGVDPAKPRTRTHPIVDSRPTVRLDPHDLKPSWPIVVASLEQLTEWAVLALRLGTLALIQDCVRDLALRDAKADLIARLRELVEALAHMPFDA